MLCSYDKTILFYFKNKDKYLNDFKISTNDSWGNLVKINENEICYTERNEESIYFFDFLKRIYLTKIKNIDYTSNNSFKMISKDLLLIGGFNLLFIININSYKLIRKINLSNSGFICSICILNNNTLLTGDTHSNIKQWKLEKDNLILISEKENNIIKHG